MIKNFKFQISNSQAGITLAEVIVSIVVIAIFSTIIIVNFPQIQRRYALSNAAYKLAQDLRKAQDLALSGVAVPDIDGNPVPAKGYGIYINYDEAPQKYIIYANFNPDNNFFNKTGTDNCPSDQPSYYCCNGGREQGHDCVVEVIDLSKQNSNLKITNISNLNPSTRKYTSINFTPPNPTVDINSLKNGENGIVITLGLINDASLTRTIYINKAGLINVQ